MKEMPKGVYEHRISDEVKSLLLEYAKKPKSQEHRDKIGKAHKGKIVSDETKEKLRLARIGKPLSQEHRDNISKAQMGRTLSDESREKLSIANKGKILSDETKEKISFSRLNSKALDGHHKVSFECDQCGTVNERYPSAMKKSKNGLHFCNKRCRALYEKRDRKQCNCSNCGTSLERTQARINRSNGLVFCNKHCSQQYKWKNPEYAKKISDNTKKCWEDPEYRNIITEAARLSIIKRRSDPDIAKKLDDQLRELNERQWADPDFRSMMKEVSKRNWDNPEFYQMQVDKMKKLWSDEIFYQTQVDKMNRFWKDEKFVEMITTISSDMMKERWKNPEYVEFKREEMRNTVTRLWSDPDHAQMISDCMRKNWSDYNYRLKQYESRIGGFIPQNIIYRDYILENEIRTSPENREWIKQCGERTEWRDFFTGEVGDIEIHHLIEFQMIIDVYDIRNMGDARNCKILYDIDNGLPMLKKYHKPLFNKLIREKYGDNIKVSDFTDDMKDYVKNNIYPQILQIYE